MKNPLVVLKTLLPIATHSHKKTGFGQRVKVEILRSFSQNTTLMRWLIQLKRLAWVCG
jgi:hypothetical protein